MITRLPCVGGVLMSERAFVKQWASLNHSAKTLRLDAKREADNRAGLLRLGGV